MAHVATGSMEGVPRDIGHKMRSAIKAKLTELGCYVDDELPDYVMVMVANKRTRSQMEEDLQLFLGGNTELFVSWLHQVLKHLQEVSVKTAPKPPENEEPKPPKVRSTSKERKVKEKKDKKASKEKHKKSDGSIKKSKKETKKKDKESRKKVPKKSKKKSKNDEIIRPNVPPLLMNLEKESEPSITDVFAGQILKNHGITLEQSISIDSKALEDIKPIRKALKRTKFPIIDPATVTNVTDPQSSSTEVEPHQIPSATDILEISNENATVEANSEKEIVLPVINISATDIQNLPREEQIREMNEIEAKIQGLKKKLADQLDSMSEDEDFLNIRTEAEELMNDFAEDVLQEISAAQSGATATPPLVRRELAAEGVKTAGPGSGAEGELPLIELQLPKRPMRERLGARPEPVRDQRRPSEDRLTPEKEPPAEDGGKSVRSRLGERGDSADRERSRKRHVDLPEKTRDVPPSKRLLSRVEARRRSEERARAGPASVVRVRPRPRAPPGAPAPSLLMRAVADAHKSLLNVAPKLDGEPQVKRALVLPMRRAVESQNIVIQVQTERAASRDASDCEIDLDTESLTDLTADDKSSGEYVPEPPKRLLSARQRHAPEHASDSSVIDDEVIKIHNPSVGKERGPQFVVTLDGLDPNVFLAKKLKTEGIADAFNVSPQKSRQTNRVDIIVEKDTENIAKDDKSVEKSESNNVGSKEEKEKQPLNLDNTPEKVIVKTEDSPRKSKVARNEVKSQNNSSPKKVALDKSNSSVEKKSESPPKKKRCVSPIVFDVKEREREKEKEKEKEKTRERKESAGSDITVTTASSNKYDSLPSLPVEKPDKRRLCRAFPACRFGAACAFSHPRCKFAAACTRRDCAYSHPALPAHLATHPAAGAAPAKPAPTIASHVVPVSNYKSVSAAALAAALPAVCKFYPACGNPACPFLHPRPCRYGRACLNRPQCNFYHPDPKWRSSFPV